MNQKPVKVRYVTVDERGDGQRIDNFLLRELKGVPRTLIYRLLRKGEVRVNKGRAKPGRKLVAGDIVRIPPVRVPDAAVAGVPKQWEIQKIEKSVMYEDNLLLIINKESGLAVHGGSGISFGVIELLRASRPNEKALELAHRLDRDTSGCLMLAKKRSALRTLQELQREGRVHKRYLALLDGLWSKNKQQVKVPLTKNTLKSGERIVRVDAAGKAAHTEFRVVKRFANATLVEAVLKTGRTHQIRVHAQYLGTPILGDEKYGNEQTNREYRKLGLKRLFLHAASLTFPWPGREQGYAFEAPLPQELQDLLDRLDV
ncbi:MAG TPA: 23S rRNA pseudouridine(955/2504/2580) synthase RluC [Chromatiaceae bacterium]|nr:23S rRNA pseudouridine(955/2504/2580) synthase RluC [Chromatiaceae bacterium]